MSFELMQDRHDLHEIRSCTTHHEDWALGSRARHSARLSPRDLERRGGGRSHQPCASLVKQEKQKKKKRTAGPKRREQGLVQERDYERNETQHDEQHVVGARDG